MKQSNAPKQILSSIWSINEEEDFVSKIPEFNRRITKYFKYFDGQKSRKAIIVALDRYKVESTRKRRTKFTAKSVNWLVKHVDKHMQTRGRYKIDWDALVRSLKEDMTDELIEIDRKCIQRKVQRLQG